MTPVKNILQPDFENEDKRIFLVAKEKTKNILTQSRKERKVNLIVAYAFRKGGAYAPKTLLRRHLYRDNRRNYKPMVDDTKDEFLKHEADNTYRRLQQGFEALRPAFACNWKVKIKTFTGLPNLSQTQKGGAT